MKKIAKLELQALIFSIHFAVLMSLSLRVEVIIKTENATSLSEDESKFHQLSLLPYQGAYHLSTRPALSNRACTQLKYSTQVK